MTQFAIADAFRTEAEQAAEKNLTPEQIKRYLDKYEPELQSAWKRIYFGTKERLDAIERRHELPHSEGLEYTLREYA